MSVSPPRLMQSVLVKGAFGVTQYRRMLSSKTSAEKGSETVSDSSMLPCWAPVGVVSGGNDT